MREHWTVTEISRSLSTERHRITWLIDRYKIRPVDTVARARVFNQAAYDLIRSEIERLDAKQQEVNNV